jgi:DNA-binding NarL/FixJ family response regulator
METWSIKLLWIDLCFDEKNAQDIDAFNRICTVCKIRPFNKDGITSAMEEHQPAIVCVDYDFPDLYGLQWLRYLCFDYPCIPVLMLTAYHSENLALFAFRTKALHAGRSL